jgi:hypothetical protein
VAADLLETVRLMRSEMSGDPSCDFFGHVLNEEIAAVLDAAERWALLAKVAADDPDRRTFAGVAFDVVEEMVARERGGKERG